VGLLAANKMLFFLFLESGYIFIRFNKKNLRGEMGRKLAKTIQEELRSDADATGHDQSTNNLINYIKEKRM